MNNEISTKTEETNDEKKTGREKEGKEHLEGIQDKKGDKILKNIYEIIDEPKNKENKEIINDNNVSKEEKDIIEIKKEKDDEDDDDDENAENEEKIIQLAQELKPKESLKDYFKRQIDCYKIYDINFQKDKYYLYDLAENDYFDVTDKFNFKKNYDKLPLVSNMFSFLIYQLSLSEDTKEKKIYKKYKG